MMLKVNGEFLDFDDFVEMEKRVKLFEQIDETLGDFSYVFNLDKTSKNLKILGFPLPDVKDKIIYREINCDLLDDSGNTLYKGVLKVERVTNTIECSFFSGNYNWMRLLTGNLSDLDFSELDIELTVSNIANSWDNTEGVIFPLIDAGGLTSRRYKSLMVEDFSGCIFVKTVFKKIFDNAGIKLQGDFLHSHEYNNMLLSRLTLGANDIQDRSTYAVSTVNQLMPALARVRFEDDFSYPYYDGSQDNYSIVSCQYTADVKMRINLEITLILTIEATVFDPKIEIFINGSSYIVHSVENNVVARTYSFEHEIELEAGDTLDIWARQTIIMPTPGTSQPYYIITGSTFKVTPTFLYFTAGGSLVPQWSQAKFIKNVISLFCVVSDYEPVSKILTFDFFENIKSKPSIDLSEYINIYEVDFSDFISKFFQKTLIGYQESNDENIIGYNVSHFVRYAAGQITVNNEYLENSGSIFDSEFKAPVSYINNAFSASLERMNFVDIEENGGDDFTSVTDNLGEAQFNVPDGTIYSVGELVRVQDSTNPSYNGDFVVKNVSATWIIVRGVMFSSDATGSATKLRHRIGSDDGVYLLINTKYRVDNVANYSRSDPYYILNNQYSNIAYAFFNMLNTGVPINDAYKHGLSFGSVDNILSYQSSLIDRYWGVVSLVLNDPVRLLSDGTLPKKVFNSITPLRPIRIKTETTNNLYYLNRIGGYKESYLPCEVDLIKLS